jgi:hypothetical protein
MQVFDEISSYQLEIISGADIKTSSGIVVTASTTQNKEARM